MGAMIDIHQHIVYGMDDGAQTMAESLQMLQKAQADGIGYIIGTSHAIPSMAEFPLERYYRHIDMLNQACQEQGIPVVVYEGCEIFYGDSVLRKLEAQRLPTLARSAYVLIEFDPTLSGESIIAALRQIANGGYVPIVAHVERYEALVKKPDLILEASEQFPLRIQMNCATVSGRMPRPIRKFRDRLLDEDRVDYLATDAHNVSSRAANMTVAYEVIGKKYGQDRADALVGGRQMEIFEGAG